MIKRTATITFARSASHMSRNKDRGNSLGTEDGCNYVVARCCVVLYPIARRNSAWTPPGSDAMPMGPDHATSRHSGTPENRTGLKSLPEGVVERSHAGVVAHDSKEGRVSRHQALNQKARQLTLRLIRH